MRAKISIILMVLLLVTLRTACAGDAAPEPVTPVVETDSEGTVYVPAADTPEPENQWAKFKAGARLAGDAIAEGGKSTGRSLSRGAQRAGEAITQGYEEVREYVHEKTE